MGISHQSLRCHKNDNSSLTTPKLELMLRMKFFILTVPFYSSVTCSDRNQPDITGNALNQNPISLQQIRPYTAYQYHYSQMYSVHWQVW